MITIPQEVLANALAAVTRASGRHNLLPAFCAVRMDMSVDGTLSLHCFNGEVAARAVITAQVSDNISLCVNAQTLKEITDTLIGDVQLKIEDNKLIVENGAHRTVLNILEEDLPPIDHEGATKIASLPGSIFRSLARVFPFASTDITRPALQIMHLAFTTNRVTALAADGFTAAQVTEQLKAQCPQSLGLPLPFARLLLALVENDDVLELRSIGQKYVIGLITNSSTMKNLVLGSVMLDSKFPAGQVSELLANARQSALTHVQIPKAVLSQVIRQVAAMGTSNALMKASGGVLKVASEETETGQARNVLNVPVTGPDTKNWLSINFLKRVTDACQGELHLSLIKNLDPLLCEEGGFSALIMPLSVNANDPFPDDEPIAIALPALTVA